MPPSNMFSVFGTAAAGVFFLCAHGPTTGLHNSRLEMNNHTVELAHLGSIHEIRRDIPHTHPSTRPRQQSPRQAFLALSGQEDTLCTGFPVPVRAVPLLL